MAFQFVDITKKIENILGGTKLGQMLMLKYYSPMVANEITLANVVKTDNILCIGGGCLPCTAILLHKKTGANVTAIDIDENAIKVSLKRLNKLGLDGKINILNTNGVEIDVKDYDLVHIALQVSPKDTVFEQVKNTAKNGCKILIRTPKKTISKGYSDFKYTTEKFAKQPRYSNIERTYLYEK